MKHFFSITRHWSSVPSLNHVKATPTHFQTKESKLLEFCRSGSLFPALHLLNSIDWRSFSNKPLLFASLLQTSTKASSFSHGIQIHAHVVKSGLETDRFVGNSLLALYFKLGSDFVETRRVFDGLNLKDVISWTSMITGYVKVDKPRSSIQLFFEMVHSDVEPNAFTLSAVVKACSDLGDLLLGSAFHGIVFARGFDSNNVISSALIDMYGRNFAVHDARQLFDELPEPDAICWTSVISGFTRNDMFREALSFFNSMQMKHNFGLDAFTFGTVLTACGNLGRTKQGKEVHAKVVTSGSGDNVVVQSSLVDMYGKCGLLEDSQQVFDRMSTKNSVSWSALLGGYCQNGDLKSVVRIFREMGKDDLYSFGTVLRACAGLAAIKQGKEIHCQYVRRGGWRDVIVESALVDLYAKCGCIDFAYRVFEEMPVRNVITWNAMISGFAQNGRIDQALALFDDMTEKSVSPDYITFIGVLFACNHSGLVNQGKKHFESMVSVYGIRPGIEHYNCMIDLLGRAGLIEEAESLLKNADCRDDFSTLWAVLLGACAATSTNPGTAERIAKRTIELKPDYHLSYVYLANVYRGVGRWEDADNIRRLMEERRVKKVTAKSWS